MGSSCGRVPATGRGPAGAEGARRGLRGGGARPLSVPGPRGEAAPPPRKQKTRERPSGGGAWGGAGGRGLGGATSGGAVVGGARAELCPGVCAELGLDPNAGHLFPAGGSLAPRGSQTPPRRGASSTGRAGPCFQAANFPARPWRVGVCCAGSAL